MTTVGRNAGDPIAKPPGLTRREKWMFAAMITIYLICGLLFVAAVWSSW